jgi:ATP-binding cassette subfamily B protein
MMTWPAERLGEALEAVARRCGLHPKPAEIPTPPAMLADDPKQLGYWIQAVAPLLGLEAEAEEISYRDADQQSTPAILRCSDGRLLVLVDSGAVLAPDLSVHHLGDKALRAELCREAEAPLLKEIDSFLEASGIPLRQRDRVRAELLRQRLGGKRVGYRWLLRLPPGSDFRLQLRVARIPRRLAMLAGAHFLQYVLWLASWWVIGVGAMQGRLDPGLLIAWVLLLLTLVPIRGLITWLQGLIAISAGGLLKERLLHGALRLDPQEIRHQGAGQLLGRILESEALESLALNGGFLALVAVIELVLAAAVIGLGAGGVGHALLLVLWTALAALLGWRYFQKECRWCDARLSMTHDLVEQMVGHRTRLAQESREQWHHAEDQSLERYQTISRAVDGSGALLMAVVPRGWLLIGIAGLAPAVLSSANTSGGLAIGIGGVLLGYRAFRRLCSSMWNLTEAVVAWKRVAPLFDAAARPETEGSPALAATTLAAVSGTAIEAHDLTFRYRDFGEPVLRGCNLSVETGDRLLIEGASGSGKSTLVSLLTGVLRPESGLLLAGGLDRQTLGAHGWLRRVAAAPQFHENHVLTGTFAFNLLMGTDGWLNEKDYEEAETICHELGLGPLLEKMPAGMLQMVGETGWQLSHGERSRVYIARALLQRADVLIFDESFAALDPENLCSALNCVLRRAQTVLVIAHP